MTTMLDNILNNQKNHMKTFKYTCNKMDLKTLKRKRLEIFDNFIFGKISYDEYIEQGKRLKEEKYG